MGRMVPLRTTSVVLVLACISHMVSGKSIAARDVRFYTLNLNLSIMWSEPFLENTNESEVITYTVFHDKNPHPMAVSHCQNITRTSCYLVPLFPDGVFGMYEYFYVMSRSSLKPDNEIKSFTKRFTRRDVEVSSPVIYNTTVTRHRVIVSIHGPATPFFDTYGSPLYMGDNDIGGRFFMLDEVNYNATLFRADDLDDTGREWPLKTFRRGLGRIFFGDLHPYTRFRLLIQSKLNRKYSSDVTVFEFRTDGDAPDVGPIISGHRITRRYCDYRDVEITWKERQNQRSNGPLTEYIIHYINDETNETDIIAVSPSNVSMTLPGLFRWHKYDVMVSSANQFGSTEGQKITIEPDIPLIDTYKPKIGSVIKVAPNEWQMTWEPPKQHNQCIVGYMITTHIDGDMEKEIIVYGFNTSSAILQFSKIGRYQVDLAPLVNDSVGTKVFVTKMYNASALKIREWSILAGVLFLLLVVGTSVIVMARKVFCDPSALPDIDKSKSMKLFKNATPSRTHLKKPPEREYFDSTRISATIVKSTPDFTDDGDDDVFQPKSTSTSLLLSTSVATDFHSLRKRGIDKTNTARQRKITASIHHGFPQPSTFNRDESEESTDILGRHEQTEEQESSNPSQNNHGYVSHAPRYKCTLSVKIPAQRTSRLMSSPSSSSDSGISASTYIGSVSDYTPSPPPPGPDDSHANATSFEYDIKVDPPYVSTQVAVNSGRLRSTSVSSGVGSDCPVYSRLDSRLSVFDPYPKGYVTMEPANSQRKQNSKENSETPDMSSSTPLSPYSKLSPKK